MTFAQGLAVSDVVNVTMSIAPLAAGYQNFGSMLIIGSSSVVDTFERIRQYSNISQVGQDFGNTTPEYLAAQLFFSQMPQPALLYIGRWAQVASAGLLHGAKLTGAQQLLTNFTGASTSSGLYIVIDGKPVTVSGLNLTGALNINNVAGLLTTGLAGKATVTWNATYSRFDIVSATTGVASSVGYSAAPTAWNSATFSGQPTAGDIINVNGVAIAFTSSAPVGNQVQIDVTNGLSGTLNNLASFCNASANGLLTVLSTWVTGSVIYFAAKTPGTGGNSYTLAKTSSVITVLGANFAGGTGVDCTSLFGFAAANGAQPPVAGLAAESALSAVQAMADISGAWYGVGFAVNPLPADSDIIAVAQLIEAQQRARKFAVTTMNPLTLVSGYTLDLASSLQTLGLKSTFIQYSSLNPYAAISAFARAFTVNFDGWNTTITLKFKQEPGVTYELLTETQAQVLKSKNCNVFVQYNNLTSILQEGVMTNGWFFDEVHGLDWLQNRLQTDLWNLLYTSTTKIPQTDAGTHQMLTTCDGGCQQAVRNGLFAPGVWTGASVGTVLTGQSLPLGYEIYAPLVATQAQANREARKGVPIQIVGKFAGAVHFANVAVTVNR